MVSFLLNFDIRRPLKRRFRIEIRDFGNSVKWLQPKVAYYYETLQLKKPKKNQKKPKKTQKNPKVVNLVNFLILLILIKIFC